MDQRAASRWAAPLRYVIPSGGVEIDDELVRSLRDAGQRLGAQGLVDTSAAVALVDHQHLEPTVRALLGRRLGLAGGAAFETFSVLTRLPPPLRRSPAAVARLLATRFPHTRFLGPRAAASLLNELGKAGIAGGGVYDALVGAVAREHRLTLATRDRRAIEIYRALEVDVELLD